MTVPDGMSQEMLHQMPGKMPEKGKTLQINCHKAPNDIPQIKTN